MLNVIPLGIVPLIAQDVTTPPVFVLLPLVLLMKDGPTEAGVLLVQVLFSGIYSNGPGAWSLIVMLIVLSTEPPLLFAHTV